MQIAITRLSLELQKFHAHQIESCSNPYKDIPMLQGVTLHLPTCFHQVPRYHWSPLKQEITFDQH